MHPVTPRQPVWEAHPLAQPFKLSQDAKPSPLTRPAPERQRQVDVIEPKAGKTKSSCCSWLINLVKRIFQSICCCFFNTKTREEETSLAKKAEKPGAKDPRKKEPKPEGRPQTAAPVFNNHPVRRAQGPDAARTPHIRHENPSQLPSSYPAPIRAYEQRPEFQRRQYHFALPQHAGHRAPLQTVTVQDIRAMPEPRHATVRQPSAPAVPQRAQAAPAADHWMGLIQHHGLANLGSLFQDAERQINAISNPAEKYTAFKVFLSKLLEHTHSRVVEPVLLERPAEAKNCLILVLNSCVLLSNETMNTIPDTLPGLLEDRWKNKIPATAYAGNKIYVWLRNFSYPQEASGPFRDAIDGLRGLYKPEILAQWSDESMTVRHS